MTEKELDNWKHFMDNDKAREQIIDGAGLFAESGWRLIKFVGN